MSFQISMSDAKEVVEKAFDVEVILRDARRNNNALNDMGALNLLRKRIADGFNELQKKLYDCGCDDEF